MANPSTKRKRSVSPSHPSTQNKSAKINSSHLQINYLTRQCTDTLPLVAAEDPLPSLLNLIGDYDAVLHRHESMAGNLGARPLGPILIKRFERLFDGPPKVLKSHGKEGTTVGWLDVVDFARNKPEQFNLEKTRDGVPVCQFYTKQSRVEISEEDYELIASGMPQKLIPPQPILEDEEKELGTLEILEKSLSHVVHLADQVSARARQLNHRLKNRKNAIISRREAELHSASPRQSSFPANGDRASVSPSSGFVAVNARPSEMNGVSTHTASAATRTELLSKFFTTSDRLVSAPSEERRTSNPGSRPRTSTQEAPRSRPKPGSVHDGADYASLNNVSPVPIPNTPSSLLPYTKPSAADRFDDSGPYKAEMVSRMEQLQRGDRIQPPCDRCRRLHMDCLKNLTACMGCTKKHAKCSWKDVEEDELRDYEPVSSSRHNNGDSDMASERSISAGTEKSNKKREYKREGPGVADEELLGEAESSEDEDYPQQNPYEPPIHGHVAGATREGNSPTTATNNNAHSPPNSQSPPGAHTNGVHRPSPPPAPVPAHAELANPSLEIADVQATRVSEVTGDGVQPTIEANDDGVASTNGVAKPSAPLTPPAAPIMAQGAFEKELTIATGLVGAPMAKM